MTLTKELVVVPLLVLTVVTLVEGQVYNLGLCRPRISHNQFNESITLDQLVSGGDYTVLYTSGLKQLEDVTCARFGYIQSASRTNQTYKFYTYTETRQNKEMTAYNVYPVENGKFDIYWEENGKEEDTIQYILYKTDSILLMYWCNRFVVDDNFENNIWLIAARTEVAGFETTRRAVLDMLYHDDYRGLIDHDMESERENHSTRYVQLKPCKK